MIGSTLIHEPDESKLASMDIQSVDDFNVLELDSLVTLDFETITGEGGVSWSEGEPVQYDEGSGMAILRVSEAGLMYLCSYSGDLDETQKKDQEKIRQFVKQYGSTGVYELATF